MCLIAGPELMAILWPLTQACITIPKFSLPFTVAHSGFSNPGVGTHSRVSALGRLSLVDHLEGETTLYCTVIYALVSKINNVFGYLESLRTAWAMYDLVAKCHTRTKTTDCSRAQAVILPPSPGSLGHRQVPLCHRLELSMSY